MEIKRDKEGIPVWSTKDGVIKGLKRTDFVPKELEKKKDIKYRKLMSRYFEYKSTEYQVKAQDILEEKSPLEKIDAQIQKLMDKKKKLQAG
jgi:hypothetical protein